MRRRVVVAFLFLVVLPIPAEATRIGVLLDGEGALNVEVLRLTRQAVEDLTVGEFEVEWPPGAVLTSDWTRDGVGADLDRLLADADVDVVLAMGLIASFEATHRGSLPKPVIAPFVLNYGDDPLPLEDGGSGVENLSYLVMPRTFGRDVETFRATLDFLPLRKVAVLLSRRMVTALPFLQTHAEQVLDEQGIAHQTLLVDGDPARAVEAIEPDVEAVLVMPFIDQPRSFMRELAAALVTRRLPSFAVLGRIDVESGLLVSLNPDIFPRIARRIALSVQSILLGDPPSKLAVGFAAGERLTINVATADAMDLPLRWATVTEADVVGESRQDEGRRLSLLDAVHEAEAANRELAVAQQQLQADEQDVSAARSQLWPQADVGLTGLVIDEDRAASSLGTRAERTLTGSARVTQLLYSEQAWANLSVQSELQRGREADFEALRMDVIQGAVDAYVNVLRAQSIERIQKDNLKLTRSNLELAQVRELVGQSGPSEALRFESQLASNVSAAIAANARRNVAEIELNRVRHRPLEEPFQTAEQSLDDALAALSTAEVTAYFGSKRSFAAFREFLVHEAMSRSPELVALDRAAAAQDRALRSANRSFWLPTLALQGDASQLFEEGGVGTDPPALPGLTVADDTNWSVALSLSLPLFEGGRKLAVKRQATAQLAQIARQRENVAERIEQRTRIALHLAGASYAAVEQAQRAADAARRSLALVVDAYAQGTVSILALLDAQNTALVAEEQKASAVYDFFIDLMEVYRSIGATELVLDPQARQDLLQRADAYFADQGLPPRR